MSKLWLFLLYICKTAGPFATRPSLIVQHRKLKCPVEIFITVFEDKVTAKNQNVSDCLSGWYLNHRTFCYQTWYGDATSWSRLSCGKKLFAVFKIKVITRADMIKTWLFLLYLLNCWFFGNQTWSDDTLSWHKPECLLKKRKKGLLQSRSRSQWKVRMSIFIQMIFYKLPNILLPNLVLWCIIMSWSVM